MTTESAPSGVAPTDPFSDGAAIAHDGGADPPPAAADGVLKLCKGVSLSFRGDALIVKDKSAAKRQRSQFCGVPVGASPSELSVPLYNVLWAEIHDDLIAIDYAVVSKKRVSPAKLLYALNDTPEVADQAKSTPIPIATAWIEELLTRAYGDAQRRKRAKVLVNPHAGSGGADKTWEHEIKPLFEAARMTLDVVHTTFSGEAVGLCEQLDIDAHDVIIPCSGDGLPYEVFNGLGKRTDARKALRQLAVAHMPCGSGNGMSCNLNGTYKPGPAALAIIKGVRTPLDLMSITQGDRRNLSFLSQSFGLVAECDLGTEHMRWMGPARFTAGIMQRIFTKRTWPCDVSVKVEISNKEEIKAHYKREYSSADCNVRREGDLASAPSVNGDSVSSEVETGEGLPQLRYGTVNDKLPSDWETTTHDKMGNFYCGNMGYMAPDANFFAAALPNDGLMDLIIGNGDISAGKYLELMTSVETGHFFSNPLVSYRKVVAYRLTPKQKEGYISIDGERIPFEPFQVEIHQGLATVLSKNGKYEGAGPMGWEKVDISGAPAGEDTGAP
ncbi:ATP-NAD kinase-like domain-containing protein [Xylariales sp. AK1849]|nr:ATP-NAD kinase-like domain-containing protein [Xylariales sp. AK1849]